MSKKKIPPKKKPAAKRGGAKAAARVKGKTKPARPPAPAPKPQKCPQKGKRGAKRVKPLPTDENATCAKLEPLKKVKPKGKRKRPPVAPVSTRGAKRRKRKRPVATKPKRPSRRKWYILSVNMGMDDRARRDIKKRKKIEGLERVIGQVYSPYYLVEETLPKAGDVIKEGIGLDPKSAREAGNMAAWFEIQAEVCDPRTCPSGWRVQVFPAKNKETGKVTNGWMWKLVKERDEEERKVLRKRKKFPGYLVANLELTPDAFHLVTEAEGVHCILMSNDKPTPMESEEAALLLLERTAVNKEYLRHREENKKVELDYKVGDKVVVTEGVWKRQSGKVVQISGPDNDPLISVMVSMLGREFPVQISHKSVVKG